MINRWMLRLTVALLCLPLTALSAPEFDGYLVQVKKDSVNQAFRFFNQTLQTSENRFRTLRTPGHNIFWTSQLPAQLHKQSWIEHVEPNFIVTINRTVSDPLFETSWGLVNKGNNEPRRRGGIFPVPGKPGSDSNIFPAWHRTKGDRSIKVAVIDTGIDYTHPDLAENVWVNSKEALGQTGVDDDGNGYVDDIHGYNFSSHTSNPMDDHRHGTHVAGIIGAQHNSIGLAGVMAKVSLIAIKFMDSEGRGNIAQAIEAVEYAKTVGADILNNSWGTLGRSQILYDLMKSTQKSNVLIVAASGNSWLNNDSNPRYPTNFDLDNLVSVAAYNAENRLTGFSCWGPVSVDIAAPGRNVISTIPGGYEVFSGTSMSAPYVSGALGLYLSLHTKEPYQKIIEKLLKTATPVEHLKGKIVTEGRMNVGDFIATAP